MRTPFDPRRWYWSVVTDAINVYSSAEASIIKVSDPSYNTWLAAGNKPTRIGSYADLWDVLTAQAPDIAARSRWFFDAGWLSPGQAYAFLVGAGLRVTGAASGIYPIDAETQKRLQCFCEAGFPKTVGIRDVADQIHILTPEQVVQLHLAVRRYAANLMEVEGLLLAGHQAEWPSPEAVID